MNAGWPRPLEVARRWPSAADVALLAAAVAIYALETRPLLLGSEALLGPYRAPDALAALLFAAIGAALLARRRRPSVAAGVALASAFALRALGYPPLASADLALLAIVYSWGAHSGRPSTALGASVIAAWVLASQAAAPTPFEPLEVAPLLVVFEGAWLLGRTIRAQRQNAAELVARTAEVAVAAERARIARELHDVVAHHVSVVVVQAEGARAAIDDDPAAAKLALGHIQDSGRAALADLRQLLGVLRPSADGPVERGPIPTVEALDALVTDLRSGGMRIDLSREGAPVEVPGSVGLAAYRIVQEALTNALRHAPGAAAHVTLRYAPAAIEVEVTDDGARAAAPAAPPLDGAPAGHGIRGIRQRAELLGGTVEVGPRPNAGFRVWARLPIEAAR